MFLYLTNVHSRTIHRKCNQNGKCVIEVKFFRRAADDVMFSNGRYNQFLPRQYTYLVHQYHCKFALRTNIHSVYIVIKLNKTRMLYIYVMGKIQIQYRFSISSIYS